MSTSRFPHPANDTHSDAQAVQVSLLRQFGPEKRSQLTAQWSDELRRTCMQGIRDRHPEYSDRQVVLEYARITLGEALFQEAFGAELADLQ